MFMAAYVARKVTKRLIKTVKTDKKTEKEKDKSPAFETNLIIRNGKLVRQISYNGIKFIAGLIAAFLIALTIFSFKLFLSAINIRNHLGYFINLVSRGDGEVLPSMQALPVLIFIIIDFTLMYAVYRIFDAEERPSMNRILFLLIITSLLIIIAILIFLFIIMAHIYGEHEGLHSGIVKAMRNYSNNSAYKKKIDRLQIEFQCCGSKKYDEWYNITWVDTSLAKKGASDNSQGNAPFSCCSISAVFPCIHHNIENSQRVYLYTPELNLSISTHGCYSRLREKKQQVGWIIIGNLFLYLLFQGLLLIFVRFLQTAHCESSKFEGHSRLYTMWLIGCYGGKKKSEEPPDLPPVPQELME
ncbi:hypothetical protein NQ317_003529 [Molorchus minor]|uniref:Tetraspanin n=1 Tax=Molorchus minor TaxID=1323400 RepID=A0ABQ9K1C1_9CUCU|nr:hypothetical protein NQ317_003529 [Molorchus minor]